MKLNRFIVQPVLTGIAEARAVLVGEVLSGKCTPDEYHNKCGRIAAFDDVVAIATEVAKKHEKED